MLAVALAERPDASATAVITSAVALAEFAVEDAARREESTLAMNAQLFQLAWSATSTRPETSWRPPGDSCPRRPCDCC